MSTEVEVNKSGQEKPDENINMGDAEVKNDTNTGDKPEVLSEKKEKTEENAAVAENAKNDKNDEKDKEANGDNVSDKEDSKTTPKTKEKTKNSKKTNSKHECSEEEESVENSEGENEKEEEDSADEKEDNDSKNKSGGRERKQVQRFAEDASETKEKVDGSGIALGNILSVDNCLSRAKPDDLKALHKLLFKTPGKTNMIRRNIRKFNGFDFSEDSDQYSSKLAIVNKMDLKQIKSFCDMLSLDKKGSKEELATTICEFLLKPKDNNIIQEATDGTPFGRPRRSAALKASAKGFSDSDDSDDKGHRSSRGKGQRASLKDETSSESDYNPSGSEGSDAGPKRSVRGRGQGRPARATRKGKDSEASDASDVSEESEEDSDAPPKKRGRVAKSSNKSVSKRSGRTATKKKADSEISESEEESAEESDEPKAKRGKAVSNNKKTSPASNRGRKPVATAAKGRGAPKRGVASKKSAQRDSSSEESAEELTESEDEPLSKKGKSQPPTDEELKSLVKEILDGANLEEITMKTVCKQVYAKYPQFDLAHKKEFIKTTVKSLIST